MLITASWDRTLRYWDLRQPTPVHTQQLPERVYAMDAVFPVLVVGLADAGRKIQVRLLLAEHARWGVRCTAGSAGHVPAWIAPSEADLSSTHNRSVHGSMSRWRCELAMVPPHSLQSKLCQLCNCHCHCPTCCQHDERKPAHMVSLQSYRSSPTKRVGMCPSLECSRLTCSGARHMHRHAASRHCMRSGLVWPSSFEGLRTELCLWGAGVQPEQPHHALQGA